MQKSPIVENSIGMQMRYIEPGVFMMGSTSELAWSDEYPVLETSIEEPYYIGVYEVTREEWFAVMGGAQPDDGAGGKVLSFPPISLSKNETWRPV